MTNEVILAIDTPQSLLRGCSFVSTACMGKRPIIVIDMYAPYISLVKKCCPNAKLIIDRFHIVQLIGRTFRNHRITWTNRLLKRSSLAEKRQGKQLKKYWKLLQKS